MNRTLEPSFSGREDDVMDSTRTRKYTGSGGSKIDYEKSLVHMYEQKMQDFETHTQPLIAQIEDDANSTDIVDRARIDAGNLKARATQVNQRQQAYNMGGLLPSQQAAAKRNIARNSARGQTAVLGQSHINQRQSQQAARVQLMSISEQLQATGAASMSQAVTQKRQRDAAYDQAKGGMMSQLGAIAGAGIGFMAGGPAGMSAGSAIGGSLGGAIGG